MSRIRGIVAKVKKEIEDSGKKKNVPDTIRAKDDVENEVEDLLDKIPKLAENFDVHKKIGEGTFSSVFLGSLRQQSDLPDSQKRWFAIKHLVPTTHPTRVAHELRCLRDMGGKNHVIGVDLCLRDMDSVAFVMPYIPHTKFTEYFRDMCPDELRQYMRALLTALRHVHSFGVIHRDVKPSNFLYNRKKRLYALVDFGLAQHTVTEHTQPPPAHQSLKRSREQDSPLPCPKRIALDLTTRTCNQNPQTSVPSPHYVSAPRWMPCACAGMAGVCMECTAWAPRRANRAGTQGFRPPEVLFKYTAQTTAVDMWAAGVVLASVLLGRYPFFRATDDLSALREISIIFGSQAMHRTAAALGCRLLMSKSDRGLCLRKLAVRARDACRPEAFPGRAPAQDACRHCRLPAALCVCRDPSLRDDEVDLCQTHGGFPDSAFALAYSLLEPNPLKRITAAEALQHPFLSTLT